MLQAASAPGVVVGVRDQQAGMLRVQIRPIAAVAGRQENALDARHVLIERQPGLAHQRERRAAARRRSARRRRTRGSTSRQTEAASVSTFGAEISGRAGWRDELAAIGAARRTPAAAAVVQKKCQGERREEHADQNPDLRARRVPSAVMSGALISIARPAAARAGNRARRTTPRPRARSRTTARHSSGADPIPMSDARLPDALVTVGLIRVEQHEAGQHFALQRALDAHCARASSMTRGHFWSPPGAACKTHAGTRQDAQLTGDRSRVARRP